MITRQALLGILALVTLSCRDAASPSRLENIQYTSVEVPRQNEEELNCDPTAIIPDPECIQGPSGLVDEYWDFAVPSDSSINVHLPSTFYVSGEQLPICLQGFAASLLPATVFPSRGRSISFTSSGTWVLLSIFDIVGRIGRYDWPDGFWPSVSGDGIQVSVDAADGVCDYQLFGPRAGFNIAFFSFVGVAYRRPRPPGDGFGVLVQEWNGAGSGPDPGAQTTRIDIEFACDEWTEPNGTYHLSCYRV